jgi:hypothetical protein
MALDEGTAAGIHRAAISIQSGARAHVSLGELASTIARLHPALRRAVGGSLKDWERAVRLATGIAESAGDAPTHGLMPPAFSESRRKAVVDEQLHGKTGHPEPGTSLSLDAPAGGRIVARGDGLIPLSVDVQTFREAEQLLAEMDDPGQRRSGTTSVWRCRWARSPRNTAATTACGS